MLKYLRVQIVIASVLMVMLAVAGTAGVTLFVIEQRSQKTFMEHEAHTVEQLSAMIGDRVLGLQTALVVVAGKLPLDASRSLRDQLAAFDRYLTGQPSLVLSFNTVSVVDLAGNVLLSVDRNKSQRPDINIADRPYFADVRDQGRVVISQPIVSRLIGLRVVIIAVPLRDTKGGVVGVMMGSVPLGSQALIGSFGTDIASDFNDGSEAITFDGVGNIISHPDTTRLGATIADEPGLEAWYQQWVDQGAPVVAKTQTFVAGDYMISMVGVSTAGWTVVQRIRQDIWLGSVRQGRVAAINTGILMALAAGLLMALMASHLFRPVGQLRKRASRVLVDSSDLDHGWPEGANEIGELSRVFQHILRERESVSAATMHFLSRLQAVLDNASVGIAFLRDGRFELVSRTLSQLHNVEQGQLIGEEGGSFFANPEEFTEFNVEARRAFKTGDTCQTEVAMKREGDDNFWAHVVTRELPSDGEQGGGEIWIVEDVTQSREMREQLAWTATHDALTKLVNRREFESRLSAKVRRRDDGPFSALFIDLDRFKHVNDTGGHAAGDQLLVDLSRVFEATVRTSDTVARLGGDEFAVILSACPSETAEKVADNIRAAVEKYRLPWKGEEYSVGASIGLVQADARFNSIEQVMRAADLACYQAKRGGRNRVCVWRPQEGEDASLDDVGPLV
jgi:diguanylate cyclase (GGDEF)-like protein/PAS domain S-box-containing protein